MPNSPAPGSSQAPGGAQGATPQGPGGPGAAGGAGGAAADPVPRPYATVITPRAKSKTGVFGVHQIGSRLYFEIPAAELGKDFIITTVLAATPNSIGINGTLGPDVLVRWERRDNRILLRNVNYRSVASDSSLSSPKAMNLIQFFPILASFNVEAYGKDSAAVIEVTRMFTGGVQELTANGRRATVDATRSFIDRWAAFSKNINVTAQQTYTPQAGGGAPTPPGFPPAQPQSTTEAYTFSMVRLPDVPMMGRLRDARVGYFGPTATDFGSKEQRVTTREFISRWRLECSDQKVGNLCVPKKPITYYVDPATPGWLKPWIKRAIEEWQPAFEQAGFYKGIVAAEAPANDPDFSGEDATVAMIRWLPSPVANAVGPSTVDPRSGEIIDADVQMYQNIFDLQRDWYFSQVGHLDPRAQKFPFPQDLMGRLIQFVAAHEVGHTLGFPHNFKASSMYPTDSIRSKTFVAKMGHSPSIMDYARFNYTAQPEDGIAIEDLTPRVGTYDKFAVMWGYSPILGAKTPEAEVATLNRWAGMQDTIPWYRFASDAGSGGADPAEQNEAVGDADAVKATGWGFKNLARVMKLTEAAATTDKSADFSMLRSAYSGVINQWATEAGHVARVVGSQYKQEKVVGQSGDVWTPVSKKRQQDAVRFLNDQVFTTPTYLIDLKILKKIESEGEIGRLSGAQTRSLNALLSNIRLSRMVEYEALAANTAEVYTAGELLTDVRKGLWKEIATGAPVDAYRRRLQNNYLDLMAAKIKPAAQNGPVFGTPVNLGDFRGLAKDEMRQLDGELSAAIGRTKDRTTRVHLQDARDQIKKMLDPKE